MNEIIDSHVHLENFEELDHVLNNARGAGVIAIIAAGVDDRANRRILEICRTYKDSKDYPAIFPSLGIHPGDIKGLELDPAFDFIEDNIQNIVAEGEALQGNRDRHNFQTDESG